MKPPVREVDPADLLTLDECKAFAQVSFSDDDELFTGLARTAEAHLDGRAGILGRALVDQVWRAFFPDWSDFLALPLGDLIAISSVEYLPSDGGEISNLDPALYRATADEIGPVVDLSGAGALPALADRDDAVQVVYRAGFGAPSEVPSPIVTAAKMMVRDMYENTGAPDQDGGYKPPSCAIGLLAPYRMVSF